MTIPLKGVLFDLDGVLVDSEPLYSEAADRVLRDYGLRFDPALKAKMMGRAPLLSAAVVIEHTGIPLSPEEFLAMRRRHLDELMARVPAMPGAQNLVLELRRLGVPMALATSSERSLMLLKTTLHPWIRELDALVCGGDPGVHRMKPHPDIFLAAAQALGLAANQCLIVEDSPVGVAAALASGGSPWVLRSPFVAEAEYPPQVPLHGSYGEFPLDRFGAPPPAP